MNNKIADVTDNTTAQQLRSYVERVERLEAEKKSIAEDVTEVFKEAGSNGFDVKAMKTVVKLRKQDPAALEEQQALVDLYKATLGMSI